MQKNKQTTNEEENAKRKILRNEERMGHNDRKQQSGWKEQIYN